MNLQQLEYVIAVDKYRHFAKAAAQCFVTQPTLSMMIQKLEEEFGLTIFDRTQKPVEPTKAGVEIISRAKELVSKAAALKAYATELNGNSAGELHLGIIPTLAPYLLPLFLPSFIKSTPGLKVFIKEMVTSEIAAKLKTGELDIGLLATPLSEKNLSEYPLFYEEFFAYTLNKRPAEKKRLMIPKDIDPGNLWLLEEGHCMRSQVFNLCELKKGDMHSAMLHYEAGSIETLVNLVDKSHGTTIVPYLATRLLSVAQLNNLREFASPKPVREISLITTKDFPRRKLLDNLKHAIMEVIPEGMLSAERKQVTPIEDIVY